MKFCCPDCGAVVEPVDEGGGYVDCEECGYMGWDYDECDSDFDFADSDDFDEWDGD